MIRIIYNKKDGQVFLASTIIPKGEVELGYIDVDLDMSTNRIVAVDIETNEPIVEDRRDLIGI